MLLVSSNSAAPRPRSQNNPNAVPTGPRMDFDKHGEEGKQTEKDRFSCIPGSPELRHDKPKSPRHPERLQFWLKGVGSSQSRDPTQISCIAGDMVSHPPSPAQLTSPFLHRPFSALIFPGPCSTPDLCILRPISDVRIPFT
ncbi:hypothetical protein MG293_000068 [Ovis ammon polii]|uniref:Uncharacterized protein n=1 Tax=Ovis ammon polii TaxID=230172 RepID=A0AAD4YH47_OVIAM|nr:hypothetical protein MG293_000068 [Ovis ammon polii]